MSPIVKDILALALIEDNKHAWASGTIGLGYLSLRNDTLRFNESLSFEPPIPIVSNITAYSWVNDSQLSEWRVSILISRRHLFFDQPLNNS